LLELSVDCKTAAKARISFMTLFPSFQIIYSGCCTVAAHAVLSISASQTATKDLSTVAVFG
jgi:hypothetical protein